MAIETLELPLLLLFLFLLNRLLRRVRRVTRWRHGQRALHRHEGVDVPEGRRVFEGVVVPGWGRAFPGKCCSSFSEQGRRVGVDPAAELMEILEN